MRWSNTDHFDVDLRAAPEPVQPFYLIGICTRGRTTLLQRLLLSLAEQSDADLTRVEILVVDNNDEPMVLPEWCAERSRFPVHVTHEPNAGLAHARNHLFDVADDLQADWVLGIDDDEWVDPTWLSEWIRGISRNESDILIGKAELIHEPDGSIFRTLRQFKTPLAGEPATLLGTCNYAINKTVFSKVRGLGLRFHPLFNETGGEDGEFMRRAKRMHNVTPYGWPHARAYEERSGQRAGVRYMLRRLMQDRINSYTIANLHHEMGIMEGELPFAFMVLKRTNNSLIYGAGRCLLGIAKLPMGPLNAGREFGRAMEHFVQAFAIVPYLTGWRRRGYGAKATEPN